MLSFTFCGQKLIQMVHIHRTIRPVENTDPKLSSNFYKKKNYLYSLILEI